MADTSITNKKFEYYFNYVDDNEGPRRNNLIYTSLISEDRKIFCQWYCNDTVYHQGQNEIVDPNLMEEKWKRELTFLKMMEKHYPEMIPKILEIDEKDKKIYLEIDGVDLWQRSDPLVQNYSGVLKDWEEQMFNILKAHKSLGIYKYSLHPSSYFVVNGKLKSINYFFCYSEDEPPISLQSIMSHVSKERQADLFPKMKSLGIDLYQPTDLKKIQMLAFESFKTNFPCDFMEKCKELYV